MSTASKFFQAISDISSLVPKFGEKRKKELDAETRLLSKLEKAFQDAVVTFKDGSRSDELLGLADELSNQKDKLEKLVIIYAKELMP